MNMVIAGKFLAKKKNKKMMILMMVSNNTLVRNNRDLAIEQKELQSLPNQLIIFI